MPRKAAPLTITELKRMRSKAEKDPTYSEIRADGKCAGLNAQCREGRVILKFRFLSPATGKRRTVTIGDFGDVTLDYAREEAAKLRRQVAREVDPHEVRAEAKAAAVEEERRAMTVAEAAALYLDDLDNRAATGRGKRGKPSGAAEMRKLLERNVLPRIGAKQVLTLTKADVELVHKAMQATPPSANRTMTAISALFGYLSARELAPPGYNPVKGVERYRENGARRALSRDELERLGGRAMDRAEKDGSAHPSALLALRFLALSGFRTGELLGHGAKDRRNGPNGLTWGDVDLDRGLVFLADTQAGGRQVRTLGAAAVELLRAAKPADAEPDHVICPGARSKRAAFVGLAKIRRKLYKAAKIRATAEGRADGHSLRHSFASVGAHIQGGRYAGHVSALLGHGHTAKAITERYITSDPQALRPAADAIAGAIARLLGMGETAKVIEHPAAKGARKGARK